MFVSSERAEFIFGCQFLSLERGAGKLRDGWDPSFATAFIFAWIKIGNMINIVNDCFNKASPSFAILKYEGNSYLRIVETLIGGA